MADAEVFEVERKRAKNAEQVFDAICVVIVVCGQAWAGITFL